MSYHTAIGGQISTTGTNLTVCPEPKELYILIKDDVVDQIIEHGLSKVESKLFFYLFKLDRFGDRPAKVKVASILLATGISKSAYHAAIVKFETMGWFDFKHSDVEIRNFCTITKKSKKQDSEFLYDNKEVQEIGQDFRKLDKTPKTRTFVQEIGQESRKLEFEELKPIPSKASKASQILQTYTDLIQTLSEGMRESFEKFCLKKIQECSFKIASKNAWLNKHGAEYLAEYQETYSDALSNPQIIAPKPQLSDLVDLDWIKRFYGDTWEAAAIHHGLIFHNSSTVEIDCGF